MTKSKKPTNKALELLKNAISELDSNPKYRYARLYLATAIEELEEQDK
jgi:hypothetical protein